LRAIGTRFSRDIFFDVLRHGIVSICLSTLKTFGKAEQKCLFNLLRLKFDTFDPLPETFEVTLAQLFYFLPHTAQGPHNAVLPMSHISHGRLDVGAGQDATPHADPRAKQQHVDVETDLLLQGQALISNAVLRVDGERKLPQLVVVLKLAAGAIGRSLWAQAFAGNQELPASSRLFGRSRSPVQRRILPVSMSNRSRTRASV
jgi:hypothetical protein